MIPLARQYVYPLLLVHVLLALCLHVGSVAGFLVISLPPPPIKIGNLNVRLNHRVDLAASSSTDVSGTDTAASNYNPRAAFPDSQIEEFVLLPHRPLGCTVEESLADSSIVFITKIVDGGYAHKAGMKVGDVLVGVTGLFGDMTSAMGMGVEKVKGIVGACPEDEALEIHVARGTNVWEEHEKVLIDLCNSGGGFDDKEIEQCVIDYLAMDSVALDENDGGEECDGEDDGNCLVDNLYNMWSEDLPVSSKPSTADKVEQEQVAPVVKPWSSRSSPSGTYVRNPATGKMTRID